MNTARWKVTSQTNGWCIHTDDKDTSHITDVDNKETATQIVTEHNAHDALCEALEEALAIGNEPDGGDLRIRETRIVNWKRQAQSALRQAGR